MARQAHGALPKVPKQDGYGDLRSRRTVASETEVPNVLVNLV
jgi:hypothetical protein